MGTGSFPGVNQPACGDDQPPPANVGLKLKKLYSYTCIPFWPFIVYDRVNFTFTIVNQCQSHVLILFLSPQSLCYEALIEASVPIFSSFQVMLQTCVELTSSMSGQHSTKHKCCVERVTNPYNQIRQLSKQRSRVQA